MSDSDHFVQKVSFVEFDMGPMSYIPTDGSETLYLGTIYNARELAVSYPKRTWSVLNCTDDSLLDEYDRTGFKIKRLNQLDGHPYPADKIKDGLSFINDAMHAGDAVLVCCHAGCSRSPGMVVAYLLERGHSYNEAVQLIRKARPFIQIHHLIDLSIRQYFHLAPRTVADLIP